MGKKLTISLGLVALLSLCALSALATSFGSFSVVRQVENANYVVRGRVGGNSVRMEPASRRPYTYWQFTVEESYSDAKLDGTIEMRQPGGEIGGIGYRVAGSAEFKEGEDVIVFLRDTEEDAKEVVGLQSGRYDIVRGPDGKETVKNGLGLFPLTANGEKLDPNAFRALVRRVNTKSLTDADHKVMVDVAGIHRHGGGHHDSLPAAPAPDSVERPESTDNPAPRSVAVDDNSAKPLDDSRAEADRQVASQSSPGWIGYLVGGLFVVCAILLFRMLTRKPSSGS